jgi:hypothetical protein
MDMSIENIKIFLLSIPPEKLSKFCSTSEKISKICADEDFVERYSKKYAHEIEKRSHKTRRNIPELPRHPELPPEAAPPGYIITKKWHWTFETWASNLHFRDHGKGEIPHFNISNKKGEIFHVYLGKYDYTVIDHQGNIIFTYSLDFIPKNI